MLKFTLQPTILYALHRSCLTVSQLLSDILSIRLSDLKHTRTHFDLTSNKQCYTGLNQHMRLTARMLASKKKKIRKCYNWNWISKKGKVAHCMFVSTIFWRTFPHFRVCLPSPPLTLGAVQSGLYVLSAACMGAWAIQFLIFFVYKSLNLGIMDSSMYRGSFNRKYISETTWKYK